MDLPPPAPAHPELFRSEDLLVRLVPGDGAARPAGEAGRLCVVTFDSFTDRRTLERPGFAEHFFRVRGIDAIHVIPRENDWYKHPDLLEALAAVREVTLRYARVVAYGSSMGAYAVLRFGGVAGARVAIALSPQFSIHPPTVPFEDRWIDCAQHFDPRWERSVPLPAFDECYVGYDPRDLDRKHIALFARGMTLLPIRLPDTGHPVTGFLQEVHLLEPLVLAICQGPPYAGGQDPAGFAQAFARQAWQLRHTSAQHLRTLAKQRWRRADRIALLEKAIRLAPFDPVCKCHLGLQLGLAGRFDEALAMHHEALAIEPGQPNLLFHYSLTLQHKGDLEGALAAMEATANNAGDTPFYAKRTRRLRDLLERPSMWRSLSARIRSRMPGLASDQQ